MRVKKRKLSLILLLFFLKANSILSEEKEESIQSAGKWIISPVLHRITGDVAFETFPGYSQDFHPAFPYLPVASRIIYRRANHLAGLDFGYKTGNYQYSFGFRGSSRNVESGNVGDEDFFLIPGAHSKTIGLDLDKLSFIDKNTRWPTKLSFAYSDSEISSMESRAFGGISWYPDSWKYGHGALYLTGSIQYNYSFFSARNTIQYFTFLYDTLYPPMFFPVRTLELRVIQWEFQPGIGWRHEGNRLTFLFESRFIFGVNSSVDHHLIRGLQFEDQRINVSGLDLILSPGIKIAANMSVEAEFVYHRVYTFADEPGYVYVTNPLLYRTEDLIRFLILNRFQGSDLHFRENRLGIKVNYQI